ncbi:MAG: heparinase II/III family protein [Chitinophagaceae bacterium]
MKYLFIACCFLFAQEVSAQTDYIGTDFKLPSHPRILMKHGEENLIKKTVASDATWTKVQQAIFTECDDIITKPPIERIQIGRRLLDKSREGLRRIFMLSYAYRLTNDQKYLQRGEKEMLAIAAFSDWNPSHFLDVAEMTMAVAIGYDWLYNGLSADSRNKIKEAIIQKGLQPSMDKKYNSWLTVSNNWNQVCNAGITYGAIAVYEDQPELSKQLINRAIKSIQLPMDDFAPDGAYPEGYSYWGYGTGFNVMFISAIEKLFGKDFGLSASPGFLKTASYMENMTGPSGNAFNYSDAGTGSELQTPMFWFANKLNDPSILWVERARLMTANPKSFTRNRLLPSVLIWSGGISLGKIAPPKELTWIGHGKSPVAMMRSSWTDSLGIYVAIKGGSASVNHAHMDIGSFIMEADGVRWAMDFGMQEYESLESKGLSIFANGQNAVRWQIFRYNNYVHNTLTINDSLQRVTGYAPIVKFSSDPGFMSGIMDLQTVYKGQLSTAFRGVALVDKSWVVIKDELQADAASTLRWTMLTPADVKITGKNTAELTKNGKRLTLTVTAPAEVTMKIWSTVGGHDYDAPNPGTVRIGFECKLPANKQIPVTVELVPQGAKARIVPALSAWK